MMSRADYVKLDDFIAEFEWTRSRHGGLVSNAAKIFDSKPRTTMEEVFAYASANFPYHTGVMIPEEYDGDLDHVFLLI